MKAAMKESMKSANVAIGLPCSFPMVYEDFMASLITMKKGGDFMFFRAKAGHDIGILRNGLVQLAQGAKATHLLQVDTDMILHPDALVTMLKRDVDIVGALYFQRYPPFNPCAVQISKGGSISLEEVKSGNLIEVDRVGTGCMLVKMEVFNNMKLPWFQTQVDDENKMTMTDDYYFCDKAREQGYKVYVDTSVPCDHISHLAINSKLWQMHLMNERITADKQKEAS